MKTSSRIGVAVIGLALASASVAAHHSFAMFEMDKNVEYQGVISEWKWQNPHVHFTLDIANAPSVDPLTVGRWDVEGGSINIMSRQGWTRASYKVGDPIRLIGHPMKDGSKGISLFYAIRPDGTRLYHDIARPKDDVKKTSGVLPQPADQRVHRMAARADSIWTYPTVLTLHTVGMTILVGASFVIHLRVLHVAGAIPAVPTDILHFCVRVVVTRRQTLLTVFEELSGAREQPMIIPCPLRPAGSNATTIGFGISSNAPGT